MTRKPRTPTNNDAVAELLGALALIHSVHDLVAGEGDRLNYPDNLIDRESHAAMLLSLLQGRIVSAIKLIDAVG